MIVLAALASLMLSHSELAPAPPEVDPAAADALALYPSAGLVLVRIEAGQPVWAHYAGDAAPERAVDAGTLFNVGSITKLVTAELTLTLAEAGSIDLDAPIADAISHPHLGDDERYALLTPRLILSHQTGLLNWEYEYEDRRLAFTFTPGEGYSYSGAAYELLAQYLEARTGERFADLARAHVFDPLGVQAYLGAAAAPAEHRVRPMNADGEYQDFRPWEQGPSAADNLFISGPELARFLTGALARDHNAAAPRRTPLVSLGEAQPCGLSDPAACPTVNGHSLGWSVTEFSTERFAYHSGSDWDGNAIAFLNSDTGDGYVAAVNGGRGFGAWLTLIDTLEPDHPLINFYASIPAVQDWLARIRVDHASSSTSQ